MVEASFLAFRVGAFVSLLAVTLTFGSLPLLVRRFIKSTNLRDRLLSLGNAFAGGLFLAGGFVHLLGEAQESFEHEVGGMYEDYPFALILCPLGFALAFFVEKVLFLQDEITAIDYDTTGKEEDAYGTFKTPEEQDHGHPHTVVHIEHHHKHKPEQEAHHHDHHGHFIAVHKNPFLPYILIAVLSLHSIIAGVAIGIQEDLESAVPIYVALISHKWIEAFALGLLVVFCSMGPIGLVIGSTVYMVLDGDAGQVITAILTAIASGTFVYVAIVDILLDEFTTARDKYLKFVSAVFGFALMTSLLLPSHTSMMVIQRVTHTNKLHT